MKPIAFLQTATVALGALVATPALSAKLEKVDLVKEGIDLKPIVVKANGSGYTGYETTSHRYLLRAFAKGKGSSHVYWVGITNRPGAHPQEVGSTYFYTQKAGAGTEGWAVYKKSLEVSMSPDNTRWVTSPRQACTNHLNSEMAKGKSKADVLKKEWTVSSSAVIYLVAAADSKSNNKKNKHKIGDIAVGEGGVVYPVQVVCRKGI